MSEDEVVCPAPALPGAEVQTIDPSEWQNLLGYYGPQYVTDLTAADVVLLPQSVTVASEGSWHAWGLVRNETASDTGVDVSATLIGNDGSELDTVTTHVLVDPLRPGEPGPFEIASSVAATDVSDVSWTTTPTLPGPNTIRDFMISAPVWELQYGDREPYDTDQGLQPPFPYTALGDVDNLAPGPVHQPQIVAAWATYPEGRILWLTTARVGEVPNDPSETAGLPHDLQQRGDFGSGGVFYLVVSDPTAGPMLSDPDGAPSLLVWVSSDSLGVAG